MGHSRWRQSLWATTTTDGPPLLLVISTLLLLLGCTLAQDRENDRFLVDDHHSDADQSESSTDLHLLNTDDFHIHPGDGESHDGDDIEHSHEGAPTCLAGQFECLYSHSCIPMGWLCDSVVDCGPSLLNDTLEHLSRPGPFFRIDASDEDPALCNRSTICPVNYFRCNNLITCVPMVQLCSGSALCPDGSDEASFCANQTAACQDLNCDFGCKPNSKGGGECYCDLGQKYNGSACVAITECIHEEQCDQLCVNLNSTAYRCDCVPGYELQRVFPSTTTTNTGNTPIPSRCVAINDPPEEDYPLIAIHDRATAALTLSALHISSATSNQSTLRPLASVSLLPPSSNDPALSEQQQQLITFDVNFSNRSYCYIYKSPFSTSALSNRPDDLLESRSATPSSSDVAIRQLIHCGTFGSKPAATWRYHLHSAFHSVLTTSQLAYEWLAGNWYLLDSSHELITACSGTFRHCANLVESGLISQPQTMAVDAVAGFIFVLEWGSPSAALSRFRLDGTGKKALVETRIIYPDNLALDMPNRLIYWTDSYVDTIERVSYDGTGRRSVLQHQPETSLIGFDVFERNIYLLIKDSTSEAQEIKVIDLFYRSSIAPAKLTNGTTGQGPLKIVHRAKQPLSELVHPCSVGNGGCEHLCIADYKEDVVNGRRIPVGQCRCATGYILVNGSRCTLELPIKRPYLLYVRGSPGCLKMAALDARTHSITRPTMSISTSAQTRPNAVAFDQTRGIVYFADIRRYVISFLKVDRATIEAGNSALSPSLSAPSFIKQGVIRVECLALDLYGDNLYFVDSGLMTVSVAKLSDSQIRRQLISSNLVHPKSLLLDLSRGKMYFSDWAFSQRKSGKIERSNMDGTGREVVIDDELQYPNGLTMDSRQGHLYWVDAYTKKLERSDLDGKNRVLILEGRDLGHPYSAAFHENIIFWTDYRDGAIKWIDDNGIELKEVTTFINESSPLMDLKIVTPENDLTAVNRLKCTQLSCAHLCLFTSAGPICSCAEGFSLEQSDKKSCSAVPDYRRPSLCNSTMFECRHTPQCIDKRHVCDGDKECIDGSDEDSSKGGVCENFECPRGFFRCDRIHCIPHLFQCNGIVDCVDKQDEANCVNATCSPGHFKCNSGPCIPKTWLCDHKPDCGLGDNSDEEDCAFEVCDDALQFTCRNKRCIPLANVCDGMDSCGDASDEWQCKKKGCNNDTEFSCDKTKCLPMMLRCNGIYDCLDLRDEADCPVNAHAINKTCPADMFTCQFTRDCIPKEAVCDGKIQCADFTDELNSCPNAVEHARDCQPSQLFCAPLGICMNTSAVLCNGRTDCPNGIDELPCANVTIPPPILFPNSSSSSSSVLPPVAVASPGCNFPNRSCTDKNTRQTVCLDIRRFCDNHVDCLEEGVDEGEICNDDGCFFSQCSANCNNVPYAPGFVCFCPPGLLLAPDRLSCTEGHPCEQWGACSQRCVPVKGSRDDFFCDCDEGYELDPADRYTCKSVLPDPAFILYSNRNELRAINLGSRSSHLLLSGLKNTIALDYLVVRAEVDTNPDIPIEVHLFWTDVLDDKIYRGQLLQNSVTNIETIVENGLTAAEGLAVDWIAMNLYWVESTLDQIEVAKINGSFRKTLITENLSSPRAIALDPQESSMFWTDWDAEAPRIEAASMDGTLRRTVAKVAAGSWPNGIALDYNLKRVYWIDAKTDTLSTVNYDGGHLQNVLIANDYLAHPFAVSLFQNYVYWSDWRTNSIVRANKWNGTRVEMMERTFTQPFDVKILHSSRQPRRPMDGERRCVLDNGGCSHLCLLSQNAAGFSCECPHSMRLDVSGKRCALNEVFLLLSRPNDIRGLDLDRPTHMTLAPISMPKVLNPIALDYVQKTIYWADSQLNEVKRYSLESGKIEAVIDSVIQQPQAFAVDWLSGNLWIAARQVSDSAAGGGSGGGSEHSVDFIDEEEEEEDDDDDDVLAKRSTTQSGSHRSTIAHHHHSHHNHHSPNHTAKTSESQPKPRSPSMALFICSLNGEYLTALAELVNFTNPQSIAVDPLSGYIYWSEFVREQRHELRELKKESNGEHEHGETIMENVTTYHQKSAIIRVAMDGTGARILVDSATTPLLHQASSLQLDHYSQHSRLYWVNLGSSSVQYLELLSVQQGGTAGSPKTLYPEGTEAINLDPSSLTLFGDRLYVAFHHDSTIRVMNKSTGQMLSTFSNGTEDLLSIRMYDAKLQRGGESGVCSAGKDGACAHLCVPLPPGNRRQCLCALGFSLHENGTACVGQSTMLLYSSNSGVRAIGLGADKGVTPDPRSLSSQADELKTARRVPSLLPPMAKIFMASSLDYDTSFKNSSSGTIFWADTDEGSISSISRDTSAYRRLVDGVDRLVDIAYDWNAGNLYWADEQVDGVIEVMRVSSGSRMVVVTGGSGGGEHRMKPTSIAVHPGKGLLFWATAAATERESQKITHSVYSKNQTAMVRIERSLLDGTERELIVEKSAKDHRIAHLAVDLERSQLYFADTAKQTIVRIGLDGRREQVIVGKVKHAVTLTMGAGGLLFWADTHLYGGAIFRMDVANNNLKETVNITANSTSISLVEANIGDHIKATAVYYQRPLYSPSNACALNNGGCQDFCFYLGPKKATHRCACSFGYVSPADNRTCLLYDTFLMYSRITRIDSVRIDDSLHGNQSDSTDSSSLSNANSPYPSITHPNLRNVIGLTYDYDRKRLIYSDIQRGSISWCHFNGSDHQVLLEKQGPIEGIFYDHFEGVLYWTSNTDSTISRLELRSVTEEEKRSKSFTTLNAARMRKIIRLGREDRLRGIAFDHCRQTLYWANWNTKSPAIQRAKSVPGKSSLVVESIVTKNIRMPNAVVLDIAMHYFYWSDARLNKIERCDLEGAYYCVLLFAQAPRHPFAMAIHGDALYWTDWNANGLFRCNKHTGGNVRLLRRTSNGGGGGGGGGVRPMGLVAVSSPYSQPLGQFCTAYRTLNHCLIMNGGCEDVCTLVRHPEMEFKRPICSCFEGRVLKEDGRRCSFNETVLSASKCSEAAGEFECTKSGMCIPFELTCDRIKSCMDGEDEDELYCATRVCPPATYHQCGGGDNRCLPKAKRCDGIVQCKNGSDEKDCDCTGNGKILCASGLCIEGRLCDRMPDCTDDASDELNCPPMSCDDEGDENGSGLPMIRCNTTTACISPSWICDGKNDCWNNEDEINCPPASAVNSKQSILASKTAAFWLNRTKTFNTTTTTTAVDDSACPADQFRCQTSQECINVIWGCDGLADCVDLYDESPAFCGNRTCPPNYFKCGSSGQCIHSAWFCDGDADCKNGLDEVASCPMKKKVTPGFGISSGPLCKHNEFQCRNFECLPARMFCDGWKDCKGGEDEPEEVCRTQARKTGSVRCNPSFDYECKSKADSSFVSRCIARSWLCNGIRDCPLSDDEAPELCGNGKLGNGTTTNGTAPSLLETSSTRRCTEHQFSCSNGVCIDSALLCNGANDCGTFEDEMQCNVNECDTGVAVCAQNCEDYPIGYRCSCREGFEPVDGGRVCRDIDECTATPQSTDGEGSGSRHPFSRCPQLCRNTYGSYVCYCAEGYAFDGVTCRSTSAHPARLLVTTKEAIFGFDQLSVSHQTPEDVVLKGGKEVVALDFDFAHRCIFWSEYDDKHAFIKRLCLPAKGAGQAATIDWAGKEQAKVEVLHSNTLRYPDGIAVDWIGGNLYWVDKGTDTIEVSKLNGFFRKVLIRRNLDEPRAIVLNPLEGIFFWTDWGEKPYIGRANMDGTEDRVLLEESLGWPNALTIDYVRRELYFADAREDYIGVMDFDGRRRMVLFDGRDKGTGSGGSRYTGHIFALSFFEGRLLWSDWLSKLVVSCPVTNCTVRQFAIHSVTQHRPMDVKMYHSARQPSLPEDVKPPCGNGSVDQCLGLCLLRPRTDGDVTRGGLGGSSVTSVCSCPEDYVLEDDDRSCRSNCTYSQFECATYKCIPSWWKCDGQNDCGGNEDEPEDCPPFKCRPGEFQCKTANSSATPTCIKPHQICNSNVDCPEEGEDELNCDLHSCLPNQMKCAAANNHSAHCISISSRCDGLKDCFLGEDELNCECDSSRQFQCANGRCIAREWVCDKFCDCESDCSDEPANCAAQNCTRSDQFACTSGQCFPSSWKCDGEIDCQPDGEDEVGCESISAVYCDENQFRCANKHCIRLFFKCDGDKDCADGGDEAPEMCNTNLTANSTSVECPIDEWRCASGHCISGHLRCDFTANCLDGSDEEGCLAQHCNDNEFQCPGSPNMCVLNDWKCDGDQDCPSGEDEANCTIGCVAREFACADQKQCIYAPWRCDGEFDCDDKSDEDPAMCSKLACPPNRFRCQSGICLARAKVCNGVADCGPEDRSDEDSKLCEDIQQKCLGGWTLSGNNDGQMMANAHIMERFVCSNKHCIDASLVCDGVDSCGDNSDEENCETLESGNHATWHHCPFGLCSQSCTWIKSGSHNQHSQYDSHQHSHHNSHKVHITTAIDTNFTLACSCSDGYTRYSFIRDQQDEEEEKERERVNQSKSKQSGGEKGHSKKMPPQQATCQANGLQAALLVSSDTGFRVVNPYKRNYQELVSLLVSTENVTDKSNVTTDHHQPSHLLLNRTTINRIETFDVLYQRDGVSSIFWSNTNLSSIFRIDITHLDGFFRFGREMRHNQVPPEKQPTMSEPVEVVKTISKPKAVSVNWVSGQIYWIEANEKSSSIRSATNAESSLIDAKIFMAESDGSKKKTIFSGAPLEQPCDLIVDPKHSYLFFSDWGHTSLKIGRSNLLGTDWRPLVSSDLEWPLGLALDYEADRLYWSDPKMSLIECVRIDGSDRQRIYSLVSWGLKPIRLDLFEDHLYVSTFPNHQIFRLEKFGRQRGANRSEIVPLVHGVPKLSDLVVVHESRQKVNLSNPCQKWSRQLAAYVSPCPHASFICLATSPKTFECTCPDGQRKMLSNRNESECTDSVQAEKTSPEGKPNQSPAETTRCPCLNDGQCRYLPDDSLFCQCSPLYEGELCEQFRCINHCLNNGACYIDLSEASSYYSEPVNSSNTDSTTNNNSTGKVFKSQGTSRCMCPLQWTGDRCEVPVSSCNLIPPTLVPQPGSVCLNGGRCSLVRSSKTGFPGTDDVTVACDCSGTGFTGEQCEECHQALYCRHGGSCLKTDDGGHFRCACLPGFAGTTCEQHLCHASYCNGYGNCTVEERPLKLETSAGEPSSGSSNSVNGDSHFRCACIRGRSGNRCQFDDLQANPPTNCDHIECVNGGTCHQVAKDRAVCSCPADFTGVHCEHAYLANSSVLVDVNQQQSSSSSDNSSPTIGGKPVTPKSHTVHHYDIVAYLFLATVVFVFGGFMIFRLHDTLCKKVQSELAFQHRRINDNFTAADGPNVEILNPIFNLDTANVDAEEQIELETEFGTGSFVNTTNFSNPIYEYKKRVLEPKNVEETENLLEHPS